VSQTRPYIVPFLYPETHPGQRLSSKESINQPLMRLIMLEVRHRLKQLDYLGLLPMNMRRLLIDENIPGPSLTLIPDLTTGDFIKLFQAPSKAGLDYWVHKGERGVWPTVSALRVRCAIEIELDRCYQMVRRRRRSDVGQQPVVPQRRGANEGVPRKRRSVGNEAAE
jgi:TAG lipase / lysophosphatidylethanolamine acyltransferase